MIKMMIKLDTSVLRICRVCGRKAVTSEELELFAKKKLGKHGRDTICKDCLNKRNLKPKPPPLPYLRKCRDCGLEAKTIKELENFVKNSESKYNRQNWCSACGNNSTLNWARNNKERLTENRRRIILIQKWGTPLLCHFCGGPISKLQGQNKDSLLIHSLDGNHNNFDFENKVPTHLKCHSSNHNLGTKRPWQSKRLLNNKKILTFKGRKHDKGTIEKMRIAQLGNKHWRWQGDEATEHAKYLREWRRREREKNE